MKRIFQNSFQINNSHAIGHTQGQNIPSLRQKLSLLLKHWQLGRRNVGVKCS